MDYASSPRSLQVAVSRAAQVIDGMELGSFCEKMLALPAEDIDRALGYIHLELPPTTPQFLAEQARLRKEKCATARAALELSGTRPLICITTEADDAWPYTSLQLRDGSIGDCEHGTNALGEVWEKARNDKGKPLLTDQFIIVCSASEKNAFEKTHLSVVTVDNMLQAVAFARQNCFDGACMGVFVTLPIVSESLLAQMLRFRKAMGAYPHVAVCFLPPPPVRTMHYGEVAGFLLKEGGGLYRISPDGGSTLQLGRYSTVADKCYVANGAWTREGWQLVKMHVTHAAGWLCFQERRRNVQSAPLRQMGKLELSGNKEVCREIESLVKDGSLSKRWPHPRRSQKYGLRVSFLLATTPGPYMGIIGRQKAGTKAWFLMGFPMAAIMHSCASYVLFQKPSTSMQPKNRLHSTFSGRITKPDCLHSTLSGRITKQDRLHSTLSGRTSKPPVAKPSQSALTDFLSSILSDAAQNAASSLSSAHARLTLQRPASSHNAKTA